MVPDADIAQLGYMRMLQAHWNDAPIFISRLGYTGEDGFELSVPADKAPQLWHAFLESPEVQPIGLAARDSLRLEMGYPLYGHDLSEETTPVEADMAWIIGKENTQFIGAKKILAQRENGADKKRVGIELTGKGIAREGDEIYVGDEKVGTLTSGGFAPSLSKAIGQAYVNKQFADIGQQVDVVVRGRKIPAMVHALSFMPARTKQKKKAA